MRYLWQLWAGVAVTYTSFIIRKIIGALFCGSRLAVSSWPDPNYLSVIMAVIESHREAEPNPLRG